MVNFFRNFKSPLTPLFQSGELSLPLPQIAGAICTAKLPEGETIGTGFCTGRLGGGKAFE